MSPVHLLVVCQRLIDMRLPRCTCRSALLTTEKISMLKPQSLLGITSPIQRASCVQQKLSCRARCCPACGSDALLCSACFSPLVDLTRNALPCYPPCLHQRTSAYNPQSIAVLGLVQGLRQACHRSQRAECSITILHVNSGGQSKSETDLEHKHPALLQGAMQV